jgi:hypothetical protein
MGDHGVHVSDNSSPGSPERQIGKVDDEPIFSMLFAADYLCWGWETVN